MAIGSRLGSESRTKGFILLIGAFRRKTGYIYEKLINLLGSVFWFYSRTLYLYVAFRLYCTKVLYIRFTAVSDLLDYEFGINIYAF